MNTVASSLVNALVTHTQQEHPRFSVLLKECEIESEQRWPDGSIWLHLFTSNKELSVAEYSRLLGTHPGLPFTVHVHGEQEPYLGLIRFVGTRPVLIEVNAIVPSANLLSGKAFDVSVSLPGSDPNWPGWDEKESYDA